MSKDEYDDGIVERAAEIGGGTLSWIACAMDSPPDDGRSHFTASTGAPDRAGDVVDQRTWKLANYRRNPVILLEHRNPVVGRGIVRIDREAGALMLSVEWDDAEVNPVGMLVAHQHRTGMRSAVSVGFRPGSATSRAELPDDHPAHVKNKPKWRAGYLYKSPELVEVSSAAVPMNAQALQVRSYAEEVDDPAQQLRRYLSETTPSKLRSALADYVRETPEALGVLRSIVFGTPRTREPESSESRVQRKIRWGRTTGED